MALKKKVQTAQTLGPKTVGKPVGRREGPDKTPPPPVVCNTPMPTYTSIIYSMYGKPDANGSCDPPTPADKGKALHDAKESYIMEAAAYCMEGRELCGDKKCKATVTITSVDNQGVVDPKDTSAPPCSIRFKVTGSITCTCS